MAFHVDATRRQRLLIRITLRPTATLEYVSAAKEALEQVHATLSTSFEDTTAQLRAAEEESEKLKTSETELRQELEVSPQG